MTTLSGMRAFTVVWIGQFISMIGSGMTAFGIGLWAWEKTGQVTDLTLLFFFFMAPTILLSPFSGAIVDRSDRKKIMILSDVLAGASTLIIFLLFSLGVLEIWHIYLANILNGIGQSFQFPAYSAAVTTMLPKEQYTRASGMLALAGSGSGILAPIAASALWAFVGLRGLLLVDIITFLVAIALLLPVFVPAPRQTADGRAGRGSLWKEAGFGFRYIFARPSLLGLQLVFFFINFVATFGGAVAVPYILARSGNDEFALAGVQSLGAVGGVVGGLLLSVWGGPKRRIHGVLAGMIFSSLLGSLPTGIGRTFGFWALGFFIFQFTIPILNGSNQAIWQAKVAPDVQGRVFSVRLLIAQITAPLALLLAGPLADRVFEPALAEGGSLAPLLGWLVGTGPGAGMGLMFVLSGLLGALVGIMGYLIPAIRDVERIMPDFEDPAAEEELPDTAVDPAPPAPNPA